MTSENKAYAKQLGVELGLFTKHDPKVLILDGNEFNEEIGGSKLF